MKVANWLSSFLSLFHSSFYGLLASTFKFHCYLLFVISFNVGKASSSTPNTFPSFLLHLNRKQRLRMKFKFPKFREGDFICCACHSRLYRDVRKWKLISVDSSIICSLCDYEIQDCHKMVFLRAMTLDIPYIMIAVDTH